MGVKEKVWNDGGMHLWFVNRYLEVGCQVKIQLLINVRSGGNDAKSIYSACLTFTMVWWNVGLRRIQGNILECWIFNNKRNISWGAEFLRLKIIKEEHIPELWVQEYKHETRWLT